MPRSAFFPMPINRNIVNSSALILLSILLLFSLFSHPTSDDFSHTLRLRDGHIFDGVRFFYQHWSGRFTSLFAMGWLVNQFDLIRDFHLISILLIFLVFLSLHFFFHTLSRFFSERYTATNANIAFLLYVLFMSRLDTAFYWMAGGVTYQLGGAFFLVYCGTLLLYFRPVERGIRINGMYAVILGLLTVILIGFNEVLMVLVVAMTAGFLVGSRRRVMWGILLVLAAVAAAAVVFAPGNQARYVSIDALNQCIPDTIVFSILSTLKNLARFTFLLLVLALLFDLDGLGKRYAANIGGMIARWSVRQRWTIILLVAFALFLMMVPGYYGKGKELPGRAQSIIFLIFASGWWLWVALLRSSRLLSRLHDSVERLGDRGKKTLIVVLIVGLIGVSNVPRLVHDMPQLGSIAEQIDRRFDRIRTAREAGLAEVVLEPLQIESKIIYTEELPSYPHYRAKEMADFLGYRGVILVGEHP